MTSSGIESVTFRYVAYYLNRLHYQMPRIFEVLKKRLQSYLFFIVTVVCYVRDSCLTVIKYLLFWILSLFFLKDKLGHPIPSEEHCERND
jgi:hypothetical protein